jgi:hypothetical protein
MARARYPRHSGPPPPALPPATRTVGQVVAEALKLYGSRFWVSLPLGLPLAIADPLAFDRPLAERTALIVALAPLFSVAYVWACALEGGERPSRRTWLVAVAVGTLVFLPAAATLGWFVLLAVAWLGLAGWAVPAVVHEGLGPAEALRRGMALGRADLGHAIGGVATLVLLYGITRGALAWLLREQAENTVQVSVLLADIVVSPVIFLGSALLYRDLAARVGTTRDERRQARLGAPPGPAQ